MFINNCIYEEKTQCHTFMSALNMHLNIIKVVKAIIFALGCLCKIIIQAKLKVLTDYAEKNNEIILHKTIKNIFKKAI